MKRFIILAAILLVVGLCQAWFLGVNLSDISARQSRGTLADLYVEGLAMGQSNLPLAQNGKYDLLDTSSYGNRVYSYFGIVPFALLSVPWHLLTGTFLSDGACILVFSQLGYLFYGCSLLYLLRDDRSKTADWLFAAGVAAVIASGGTCSLMGRPSIYEIEAAGGYACLAGAFASLVAGFGRGDRKIPLMGTAALFAGLAMGCRPNCFPAVAIIASVIGYCSWSSRKLLSEKIAALTICWTPLIAVGVILAAWNYKRFSSVFEFGYSYTAFAVNNPTLAHFSAGNLFYNLHRYLLGGFRIGHYFPFIEGTEEGPFPLPLNTHEPVTELYGSLILFPVVAYGLLAVLKRRLMASLLIFAAAGNLLYLSGLGFATYRYPVDYLGALSFAAAIGICCLPAIQARRGRSWAFGLLIPILAWSIVSCVLQTATIARATNLFDVERPADFSTLSSPFNAVAFGMESLTGSGPRAIRLTVMLPKGRTGRTEPILVTGQAGLQDFVYFYYVAPDEIEVGFESTGFGGPVSQVRKIDYDQPHTVDISLGSFLPPDRHPLLRQLPEGRVALARNLVHVEIDDRTILEDTDRLHPTRARLLVGESPDDPAFGARFTGTIRKIERPLLREVGVYPRWQAADFGPMAVTIKLRPMPIGSRQPLLSLGYRPTGGVLFIEILAFSKCRLGWQRYNEAPIFSGPFDWSYAMPHAIEFFAGGLLPPEQSDLWSPRVPLTERASRKGQIVCTLDGREIWRLKRETADVSPLSVIVGQNGLLESNITDVLYGDVLSETRKSW